MRAGLRKNTPGAWRASRADKYAGAYAAQAKARGAVGPFFKTASGVLGFCRARPVSWSRVLKAIRTLEPTAQFRVINVDQGERRRVVVAHNPARVLVSLPLEASPGDALESLRQAMQQGETK